MTFDLAAHIRTAREELGLSQTQLAGRAGINQGDLSRIEAGERDPRWSTVTRISAALGELILVDRTGTERTTLSPKSRAMVRKTAGRAKLDLNALKKAPIPVKR